MKNPTTLSSKKFKDIVVEFPNESLNVNNGELFCTLCDKQLLTKRSILVKYNQPLFSSNVEGNYISQ